MSSEIRPIYVIDTNVLVDYPDIIPNGGNSQPESPTVDLANSHLVIPSAVVRELSSFKKEKSDRGKAARVVLRRLRKLVESNDLVKIDDVYKLEASIKTKRQEMLISVFPVHKNFSKSLPFNPSEDDMDGQIILAAMAIMALEKNLPINGTARASKIMQLNGESSATTLLTNDNGLAIRARERGVKTLRYGYQYPEPYTGRRDIVVPDSLFSDFYNCGEISRKDFEAAMP